MKPTVKGNSGMGTGKYCWGGSGSDTTYSHVKYATYLPYIYMHSFLLWAVPTMQLKRSLYTVYNLAIG
jgi:hypothetical protein